MNFLKLIKRIYLLSHILLGVILLSGCSSFKVEPEASYNNNFSSPNKSEKKLSLDSNESLGMALSGGGIRSALFNIGVLKALYDEKVIGKIDIISATSGGGYALYWLMTSHMTDEGEIDTSIGLGDNVFKDVNETDNFLVSTCELAAHGNFALGFKSYFWKNIVKPKEYYRGQIIRTFGHINDPKKRNDEATAKNLIGTEYGELTIDKFQNAIREKKLPYFVFNATASEIKGVQDSNDSKLIENGWRYGLFEFTPYFRGNEGLGYEDWRSTSSNSSLSQISAAAGAAVRSILGQNLTTNGANYIVSDGGHSENLATVALIRRGVKNIILVDSEDDSELAFEGYYILKDHLLAWNYKLKNDFLDSRKRIFDEEKPWLRENKPTLENSEFKVEVTDMEGKPVSTIYYIKMAVVGELKKELSDKYYSYLKWMKEHEKNLSEYSKIREVLTSTAKDEDSKNWNCTKTLENQGNKFSSIQMLEEEAIYAANGEHINDFPNKTTFDQSWKYDEVISWIGLGYIQGKRLMKKYNTIGLLKD